MLAEQRPGSARLLRAIRLGRRGSRSPAESKVRRIVAMAKVQAPELHAPITGADGRYLGSPDFVWRKERVVLEYEGDDHRERRRFRKDIVRYDDLAAEGWRIVRATGDDLTPEGRKDLIRRLRRALSAS